MQAVILAAGRGTRMVELTGEVPKPMLPVGGRPLLEYKLDAMPDEIDEVVLVIGYQGAVVRKHFGGRYGNKRIQYVEQRELNGTAGALWSARPLLHDRFLVMMGDDIYAKEDVAACMAKTEGWVLLVQQLSEMHRAGSVQLDAEGGITGIIESNSEDGSRQGQGIASTNLCVLDMRLFSSPMISKHAGSLEFGLPQTIVAAAQAQGIRFEPVFTDKWIQITAPKDLVIAEETLKNQAKKG